MPATTSTFATQRELSIPQRRIYLHPAWDNRCRYRVPMPLEGRGLCQASSYAMLSAAKEQTLADLLQPVRPPQQPWLLIQEQRLAHDSYEAWKPGTNSLLFLGHPCIWRSSLF